MQRTDPVLFCSMFSVLLAATIFFVYGCDDGNSGSTVSLAGETRFDFTGEQQEFIVSADISSITVQAFGGAAGDGWNVDGGGTVRGVGGRGAYVEATLTVCQSQCSVAPGETLYVYVGGAGEDADADGYGFGGWNGGGHGRGSDTGSSGGGGGGATDIRRGGQELTDRILVAGGGGAGSGWCPPSTDQRAKNDGNGGDAGDTVGGEGVPCQSEGIPIGTGGTQSEGGETGGALGVGGTPPDGRAGAAGGGGWYGGGASDGSGGGAGSSYVTPDGSSAITHRVGARGDGYIFIKENY
jgi:hypothetical protein